MKYAAYFCLLTFCYICVTAWKTPELYKSKISDATLTEGKSRDLNLKKVSLAGLLDPKKTWRSFLRLSEKNERKEREREKKKKKAIRQLKSGRIHAQGPTGPVGPRGPRGHRGPKGANVTKVEIFQEFRTMVKEMASRKFRMSTDPMCTEYCIVSLKNNNSSVAEASAMEIEPLFDVNLEIVATKVITAFMWVLATDMHIPRKTFLELQKFLRPFSAGAYERNAYLSSRDTGRFVAPRTGFYTFFVHLHFQLPMSEVNIGDKGDDLFSVLLCIESGCQENMNLESISGFGLGQKTTVSVNGMLHLEESQYVSIFIDNYSRFSLKIYDGSKFSGHLTGL